MTATSVETPSMYERIGGGPALAEAVDRLYRRLVADPELAPYFGGADLTVLKRHQAALLTQVLGGPAAYAGRDLADAHRALQIPDGHFDRVAFYIVGTLWELAVPVDIIMTVGQVVMSLRTSIVRPPTAPTQPTA